MNPVVPSDGSKPRAFAALAGFAIVIFLVALGVRILSWHDTRLEVGKVQTAVTADYQRVGQLLREGGISSFFSPNSPLSNPNNLGHPSGYSILMAFIDSLFGSSNTALQLFQIIADALSAVLIFLIVADLINAAAGAIAGMLAALSPQLAWNAVLLLPDSLFVLPILIAVYLLVRATRKPHWVTFLLVGISIGVACWLRANAMLLVFFVAAAVLLLFKSGPHWRAALIVVLGTVMVVMPLTIRNAIVFHRFIPLSLGAGQTLLEGIADYDRDERFGIPRTDVGIIKQEAELYQRPDYNGTLFYPDGVERERERMARGFKIIRTHPFWFAGVMLRRASSMMRLERARLISLTPPVNHSLNDVNNLKPLETISPAELLAKSKLSSPAAKTLLSEDGQILVINGDASAYNEQFSFAMGTVQSETEYVVSVPVRIERGRMRISISNSRGTISSVVVETVEGLSPEQQPWSQIQLPFVALQSESLRLTVNNEASNPASPVMDIGSISIFELGKASFLWTRYPRLVIHGLQKIFLTVVMLPLAIMGLLVLVFRKQNRSLVILLVVPVYFFCVQSIVHTEYRYVLALDYFLFALAAAGIYWISSLIAGKLSRKVSGSMRP